MEAAKQRPCEERSHQVTQVTMLCAVALALHQAIDESHPILPLPFVLGSRLPSGR